jgi:hypothetical protein
MPVIRKFLSQLGFKPMDDIPAAGDHLISRELQEMCVASAKNHGVRPDIHSNDFIFHFLITNPTFLSQKDAVDYYFNDGAKSAAKLSRLLFSDLKFKKNKPLKLLEFASGYGCLTRHLSRELPTVSVISCDIHKEAVDFINKSFLTDTRLSESVPENLKLNAEFDVVFALSFFSHMPRRSWGRWIKTLYSGVKENGYLIFTTQGKESGKFMGNPTIPEDGFWFMPQSEQKDLDSDEYGQTIVTPDFVIGEVYQQTQAPMVLYRNAFWWEHQDLYILAKPGGSRP